MLLPILQSSQMLQRRIFVLRNALMNRAVIRQPEVKKYIFLCGANKKTETGQLSERRKALIEFAHKQLPHTKFFVAEHIFEELLKSGPKHNQNLLDLENLISDFSDQVIIILESNSAFTELGAFSNQVLRNKLIVINDRAHDGKPSFINLGPLQAIKDASGLSHVINYKMSKDGIEDRDAIGDVYARLYELLATPLVRKRTPVTSELCNPAIAFNKDSAMFLHDLIFFLGPISHPELVEVLKLLFGESNFRLREHTAILQVFKDIKKIDVLNTRSEKSAKYIYKSSLRKPYLDYQFDTNKLISSFKKTILKYAPERIYGNQG